MSDEEVGRMVDLAFILLLLITSFQLGGLLARRKRIHEREDDELRFARFLELSRREWGMQLKFYEEKRFYAEKRRSYERLAFWLCQVEQSLDEIYAGAITDNENIHLKAESTLQDDPWNVIKVPMNLAFAQFFWSAEVHALLGKIYMPYAGYLSHARQAVGKGMRIDDEQERGELWRAKKRVINVLAEIRAQGISDLSEAGN